METLRNAKRVDELFERLVPRTGNADTREGEMIRAIARMGYRFFNDGDKYFEGYGVASSAGNAHAYLVTRSPVCSELQKMFQEHCDFKSDKEYIQGLEIINDFVCNYVEDRINSNCLTQNDCDMLDCDPLFSDEEDIDE